MDVLLTSISYRTAQMDEGQPEDQSAWILIVYSFFFGWIHSVASGYNLSCPLTA